MDLFSLRLEFFFSLQVRRYSTHGTYLDLRVFKWGLCTCHILQGEGCPSISKTNNPTKFLCCFPVLTLLLRRSKSHAFQLRRTKGRLIRSQLLPNSHKIVRDWANSPTFLLSILSFLPSFVSRKAQGCLGDREGPDRFKTKRLSCLNSLDFPHQLFCLSAI